MCIPIVAGFVVESIIAGAECIPASEGFAVASKCPVEFAGSVGEYFVVASKCPVESVARSVGEFNCSCKIYFFSRLLPQPMVVQENL